MWEPEWGKLVYTADRQSSVDALIDLMKEDGVWVEAELVEEVF